MRGSAPEQARTTVLLNADIPSSTDAALIARESMTKVAGALAPSTLADALLVISELVTNAVRHGPGRGPIHLEVRRDGVLRIEVEDQGTGFEPRAHPTAVADIPTGGFGLPIVRRLSTSWGVTPRAGTTLVWSELTLPEP
jgi:anti-sigma regulatory factor (Ser/Thr protein kinase)